jgi:2-keto-4-pentenoate hydratase
MLSAILLLSGAFAATYGSWRGYVAARAALLPLVRDGEPTRALVERAQAPLARARVRLALRHVAAAVAWLAIAMYGLYLVTAGLEVAP